MSGPSRPAVATLGAFTPCHHHLAAFGHDPSAYGVHCAECMSVALPFLISPKVDVLVVDDNPFMRAAVSRILQRQRRQCVAVATVDEAKMTLLDHPPSLVLTDFAVGNQETGVDLIRWIKARPGLQGLACGLMSGSDKRDIQDALASAGLPSLPILAKPFGLSELEAFLGGLLAPARNTGRFRVS